MSIVLVIMALAGAGLVIAGATMLHPGAGVIAAGAFLLATALLVDVPTGDGGGR